MKPILSNKQATVLVYLLANMNFPSRFRYHAADQVLLLSFVGPYDVIQYSLTAGIARSEKMELEYITTKPIIIRENVSTNNPQSMEPAQKHRVRRMQTSKHGGGSIFLSDKIDCCGYCPGESISINAKLEIRVVHKSMPSKHLHCKKLFYLYYY